MIWLSAYQAMDGAMSHRQFGKSHGVKNIFLRI